MTALAPDQTSLKLSSEIAVSFFTYLPVEVAGVAAGGAGEDSVEDGEVGEELADLGKAFRLCGWE